MQTTIQSAATLGGRIAALRKAKAMTQEQLAAAVGVSAPAVSKWETDASCPDIALLCPLARALGTNVDTLLQFERALSDEEAVQRANAILETAMHGGLAQAETDLQALLHTYPACPAVQFHGAVLYNSFGMLFPESARQGEQGAQWQRHSQRLLQTVLDAGPSPYWQSAAVQLAGQRILAGELDGAQALLDQLPQRETNAESLRATLYLRQGKPEKARAAVQKQLYLRVNELLAGLLQLSSESLTPDPQQALAFCQLYSQVSALFDLPAYGAAAALLGGYLRLGDHIRARQQLVRYLNELAKPLRVPESPCFAPAVQNAGSAELSARQLRRLSLQAVAQEEQLRPLLQDAEVQQALEALRAAAV